jgi:hypothetical protein
MFLRIVGTKPEDYTAQNPDNSYLNTHHSESLKTYTPNKRFKEAIPFKGIIEFLQATTYTY